MDNRKPEEIPCPECNSKDWLIPKKNSYLIDAALIAISLNTFNIINSAFSGHSIKGTSSATFSGIRVYECKNCKYNKFYSSEDTVDDINNAIEELEKITSLTFKKISKKS